MLYYFRLIRAPGLSAPASLMRHRRAVLQTPPKSSVPLRLPFYKNCPPATHSKSPLLQLLIPPTSNSPESTLTKNRGRGLLLPTPKFCNSSLRTHPQTRHAATPATPIASCTSAHFPSPMGCYPLFSIHFFPGGNRLGSAGGVSAMDSNSGNCCRSGSGTFTLEPFKMLINCSALTTPFP